MYVCSLLVKWLSVALGLNTLTRKGIPCLYSSRRAMSQNWIIFFNPKWWNCSQYPALRFHNERSIWKVLCSTLLSLVFKARLDEQLVEIPCNAFAKMFPLCNTVKTYTHLSSLFHIMQCHNGLTPDTDIYRAGISFMNWTSSFTEFTFLLHYLLYFLCILSHPFLIQLTPHQRLPLLLLPMLSFSSKDILVFTFIILHAMCHQPFLGLM